MKFLVLCVVACFAPNLLDTGETPHAPPPPNSNDSFSYERAPLADTAEPDDAYDQEMQHRRPKRHGRESGRLRNWIRKLRDARQERSTARNQRLGRRREARRPVDEAPPAPDVKTNAFRPACQ